MPFIYNGTGRTINYYDNESNKGIIIEPEQVIEIDEEFKKRIIKEYPKLKDIDDKNEEEESEPEQIKSGDPEISKMQEEERYVCSNCDAHFGKGEYRKYRLHLKKHA